jgi:2-amino-4-hydroxy-6-hydroxymethyldihydropteridine diphosphokinase
MQEKLLVLLLGSNLGNRLKNLEQARNLVEDSLGDIQALSSIYETASWGYKSGNAYFNQCISLLACMDPDSILGQTQEIEKKIGRKSRSVEYADRLIDIDILFYGDMVLSLSELQIPHKKLQDRRFALIPLAEILPDFEHPVFNKKVKVLLAECKDILPVRRIDPF